MSTKNADHNAAAKAPGTWEAQADGCLCPRLDNGGAISFDRWPDGWWVRRGDCPLHGFDDHPTQPKEASQ